MTAIIVQVAASQDAFSMRIAHARLTQQRIAGPTGDQPGDVVRWLGALQAQDYRGALWAIGLRTTGATERSVEQALAERIIVRTWPMRGTLHFVAAPDVRWLLALLTPRVIAHSAGRYRQLELDEATFRRSKEVFARALQGGQQLTRDEMLHALEHAGIAVSASGSGQRGYHLLARAAQDALICFGAPRGKQQTFVLLDEWVSEFGVRPREEALAELTTRYFTSHGPATAQDLMHWSGLTAAEVKTGLGAAGQALTRATIGDQVHWLPRETPALSRDAPAVHLLPGFDEYLLGYRDRRAVLDPAHALRVCPGNNGMFNSTLMIDGKVTGVWKRTLKKAAVIIEVKQVVPTAVGLWPGSRASSSGISTPMPTNCSWSSRARFACSCRMARRRSGPASSSLSRAGWHTYLSPTTKCWSCCSSRPRRATPATSKTTAPWPIRRESDPKVSEKAPRPISSSNH